MYQVLSWPIVVASLGDDVADLLKTIHRGWVSRSSPGKIVTFLWRVKSQFGAMKDWVDGQVGGHLNGEGRSLRFIPSRCQDRPRPHPFREELARDILFKAEFRGGTQTRSPTRCEDTRGGAPAVRCSQGPRRLSLVAPASEVFSDLQGEKRS
ncbi:hypothetical protein CBR_g21796 [Chara braunii]|uniref:Uncharacterized protein n=1 Tax=Chara braunii TaxID=69332 RepID=A0A388JUH6_CHABU|nr:hypothetical protein CBR_g21796 [Chara braunii]|eukprot:GBG61451.1 hypothetical protein CBR_g21796 [Chara braunii]